MTMVFVEQPLEHRSINDKDVCRTALATHGLLKIQGGP